MKYLDESSENLLNRMMQELWRLRSYYRRLMFCGCVLGTALILSACYLIPTWWGRIGTIWLGASVLSGVLWIYLNAFQRMKHEISYYRSLYNPLPPRNRMTAGLLFSMVRKATVPTYFYFFIVGFLLALLVTVRLQDDYETGFFTTLTQKVKDEGRDLSEDTVLARSLHLTHTLLVSRSAIYNVPRGTDWIAKYLHPLSSDLVTADGACGSYASVLCRLLQTFGYKTRLLQMEGTDGKVCHIIMEVLSSHGWVVLDPLYDLYFMRADGRLASFADVAGSWTRYSRQAPADYNSAYAYTGARYTNWNKIPLVMPFIRMVIGWRMGKDELDHLSIRTYFLRKYQVMGYLIVLILVMLLTRPLIRLLRGAISLMNFYRPPVRIYS